MSAGGGTGTRAGRGARALVPPGTVLLAGALDLLPFGSAAPGAVQPALLLVATYWWSLHRPDLLSSLDLFGAGLLLDLAGGTPAGSTPLALLAVRRFLRAPQRPALARSFPGGWAAFVPVLAGVQALRWAVAGVAHGTPFPAAPLAAEALLTLALYPPVAWALSAAALALGPERGKGGDDDAG